MAASLPVQRVRALYTGIGVVVPDSEDWEVLYSEGSYGKGTFSRGKPNYGVVEQNTSLNTKEFLSLLKLSSDSWHHREEQRRTLRANGLRMERLSNETLIEECRERSESIAVRLKSSKNDLPSRKPHPLPMPVTSRAPLLQENLPTMNKSTIINAACLLTDSVAMHRTAADREFELRELLHLSSEEAFYLAFEERRISVHDERLRELSTGELWSALSAGRNNFLFHYGCYVHFKSNGWVPKCGHKFGVDFLLYKGGPDSSHSEYGVVLRIENEDNSYSDAFDWLDFSRTNRVLESVVKRTLICYVSPTGGTGCGEEPVYRRVLEKLQFSELVLDRWKLDPHRGTDPNMQ